MRKFSEDYINQIKETKFNRLVLLNLVIENNQTKGIWQCDCGKTIKKVLWFVINNYTRSCGCLKSDIQRKMAIKRNYKHGEGHTRLAGIWRGMINRCYGNCGSNAAKYYKDKVDVCEEWKKDFIIFKKWAITNGYQDNLTIERINNDQGYCPGNCTWILKKDQVGNRRNTIYLEAFGENKRLIDWLEDKRCVVSRDTIKYRLKHGWDNESALSIPSKRKGAKK